MVTGMADLARLVRNLPAPSGFNSRLRTESWPDTPTSFGLWISIWIVMLTDQNQHRISLLRERLKQMHDRRLVDGCPEQAAYAPMRSSAQFTNLKFQGFRHISGFDLVCTILNPPSPFTSLSSEFSGCEDNLPRDQGR
ncbi:uncharacterized protein BDR25DRAFT_48007 [Lindgomyces ingoldianus]|uniref:Uncharacterized protein n=1 Tax=Lindgomyces ingoldianus TaxID=673940 RepID=A0ACB6QRV1_9PLEO|nr:uncharacterized protein BDR25DRAFT_48007 [Lindgomyces ingoldianus]KAF2469298.1 hypothetical protein BDR25DRAFT_48007 [Lindgomyces ingoldianus]